MGYVQYAAIHTLRGPHTNKERRTYQGAPGYAVVSTFLLLFFLRYKLTSHCSENNFSLYPYNIRDYCHSNSQWQYNPKQYLVKVIIQQDATMKFYSSQHVSGINTPIIRSTKQRTTAYGVQHCKKVKTVRVGVVV
jgi:hypothetical protein